MTTRMLKQIGGAISTLNPHEVQTMAERPVHIGVMAPTERGFGALASFLSPGSVSALKRSEQRRFAHRIDWQQSPRQYDIKIYEAGMPRPDDAFVFYPDDPQRTVKEILAARNELRLALARMFPVFREAVAAEVVREICRE